MGNVFLPPTSELCFTSIKPWQKQITQIKDRNTDFIESCDASTSTAGYIQNLYTGNGNKYKTSSN